MLSRDELLMAIRRVSQFADERSNSVRIRLEINQFKVSSSEGEPKVIAFNSPARRLVNRKTSSDRATQYLVDFLKAVDSSNVRFEFKEGQLACELKPDDSPAKDCTYRCVVMPLRG